MTQRSTPVTARTWEQYMAEAYRKMPAPHQAHARAMYVAIALKEDDGKLCYPSAPKDDGRD